MRSELADRIHAGDMLLVVRIDRLARTLSGAVRERLGLIFQRSGVAAD